MQGASSPDSQQLAAEARALVRGARTAVLSSILAGDGSPYGSLVLGATLPDASPVLLLSKLAVHTQNLAHDPRASLLYDATRNLDDPLTGARLSLTGVIEAMPPEMTALCRTRFLARHPSAAAYADFADFVFYRLNPERAHFVAGFGRIHWIEKPGLTLPPSQWAELAEAEEGIVAHMNRDHRDSIAHYAERLLGQAPGPWRMSGCDPEGCDIALEGKVFIRLPFATLVSTAAQAREELVRLRHLTRAKPLTG